MNYTVYQLEDVETNQKFISAYLGTKDINLVRLSRKDLSKYLKNKNIIRTVISIEKDKFHTEEKLKKLSKDKTLHIFRIDKKIPVQDSNGIIYTVYKDDPLYVSGKLTHIHKGMIVAKDKFGKNKYISKEIWEEGNHTGVMKNRVTVRDSFNNTFSVEKDNINYINGKYKFISTGTTFKKSKQKKGFKQNNYNNLRQQILIKKYKEKYPNFHNIIRVINGKFFIENYCKHGNLILKKNIFDTIYNISEEKIYCNKCRDELINNKNFLENEIENYRKKFIKLSAEHKAYIFFKKPYLKFYYPFMFKIIENISIKFNTNWMESCYIFKNSISKIPRCNKPGCNNKVSFASSAKRYNLFCDKHGNNSFSEIELHDFIKEKYSGKIIKNYRLNKKEIDIFLPELNLGFEFNGLYWHSDLYKEKDYHYNKWKYFKEKNIKLINVWEDDWKYKQNLIKSMVLNQLNLNQIKIYARKTEIKEVNYLNSKEFLETNHIQGFCSSSIRLGLFYNSKLVSLMTFGKKRMVLKSKSKGNQFELLRFCNSQNISVIGGASKLFKHFIKNFNSIELISYANLDISNGKLYEILGFTNMGHTGLNYWWVKDKRYHRSNFMKHNLVASGADPSKTAEEIMRERNYNKIYGTGNIKFMYEK